MKGIINQVIIDQDNKIPDKRVLDKKNLYIRNMIWSIIRCICLISLSLLCLTGCGDEAADEMLSDDYEETTIAVDKKGRIVENIVESFSAAYYDVEEIKEEFNTAIDDYNSECGSNKVKLKSDIKQENGKIYVKLYFEDYEAYKAIQNEDFFFGTIGDAAAAGYNLDVTLKSTTSGDKINRVEIMGMKDKHIVIFAENARLIAYAPISYVSANVDLVSEKEARLSSESGSGLAYIVLEK